MNTNDFVLFLLLTVGLNAPVLSHWGIRLNRLLCLMVPEGETRNVVNLFCNFHALVIGEGFTPSSVTARLAMEAYTFILFTMNPNKKNSAEILDLLYGATCTGYYGSKNFTSTVIIISEDQYLRDPDWRMFMVSLNKPLLVKKIALETVVPQAKDLSLVQHMINGLGSTDLAPAEYVFCAASCFSFPIHRDDKLLETHRMLASSLSTADEIYHSEGEYLEMLFQECLAKWIIENNFSDIIELPNISAEDYQRLSSAIFFNETNYVFISESLFGTMTRSLKLSSVVIKRVLVESGIIVPEANNHKSFTVKMNCIVDSKALRPRMLRFDSNKLVSSSGMKLIDFCKIRKKERLK